MSHNRMDDSSTSSSEDEVPSKQRKIEPSNIGLGPEELDLVNVEQQSLPLPGTSGESSSSVKSEASGANEASSNASDNNRSHPPQELNSVNVEQQSLSLPGTSGESSSVKSEASTANEASSSASDNNGSLPQPVPPIPELDSEILNINAWQILGKVRGLPNPEAVIPSPPALQFYSNAIGTLVQQRDEMSQLKHGAIMKITNLSTNSTRYCEFVTMPPSSTIEANQTAIQQKLSDTEQPGRSEEVDSVYVERQSLSLPETSGESSSSAQSEASRANEASSSAFDNNRFLPQPVQGVPEQGSGVVNLNDGYVVGILGCIPNQINNEGSAPIVLIPAPPAPQFYSIEAGSPVQQLYGIIQVQNDAIMNITLLSTNNSTTNYSGLEATPPSPQIEANQTGGLGVMPSFLNPINTEASAPGAVVPSPPAPQSNNNEACSRARPQFRGLTLAFDGTIYVVSHRREEIDLGEFWSIEDDYTRHRGIGFTCNKCREERRKRNKIEDHIWVEHTGGKFKCPFCLKPSLETRDGLRTHMKKCPKRTSQAIPDCSNKQNK